MFPKNRLTRELSHGAMALAAFAAASAAMLITAPAMAKDKKAEATAPAAAKITPSKTFLPLAQKFQKALEDAKKRPEVVAGQQNFTAATAAYNAATTSAARKDALAQRDAAAAALAATVASERAQLDAVNAGAVTPDDKYYAAQFLAQLGVIMQDKKVVRSGYLSMIESGKLPAADVPKYESIVGTYCYQDKDYACARVHLPLAIAGGVRDENNELLLADSYFKENMTTQGVDIALKAIAERKAAKLPYGPEWYGTTLNAAFKAKLLPESIAVSQAMVADFPTTDNWRSAIRVLRWLGKYPPQDMLDLLRLMKRTGTFEDATDYNEYIENADKLRFPAEVTEVTNLGIQAGKLDAKGDVSIRDYLASAKLHETEDRAGMAAMEGRANAPAATFAVINAAADVLQSYGFHAKAEALFNLALTKPTADAPRILTRIGMAQLDQGKFAEAQATFAKVTGPRQPLAQLLSLYTAQKAKGG
jgi:hypothetical protein